MDGAVQTEAGWLFVICDGGGMLAPPSTPWATGQDGCGDFDAIWLRSGLQHGRVVDRRLEHVLFPKLMNG
jgi:hypothetical protein